MIACVVVGDGAIEIVLLIIGVAALVVGGGVLRIEPDGFAQIGDGAIEIAAAAQRDAAIVIDAGVVRIEAHGLVVIRHGGVAVALVGIGVAAVVVGLRVRWDRDGSRSSKSAMARS